MFNISIKGLVKLILFLLLMILGLYLLSQCSKPVVSSPDLTTEERDIHYHYGRSDEGYMILDGHYINCTLEGWKQQSLYFRHNLAVLSDFCELTPMPKLQ